MNQAELRERAQELELAEEELGYNVRALVRDRKILQFDGPPVSKVMGRPYLLLCHRGRLAEGAARPLAATLQEAVDGFLAAVEQEIATATQLAWRRKPEIQVHDGGRYSITARFAVWGDPIATQPDP